MKSKFQYFISFFAICMVCSSAIGGILNFSYLPFWDMWDGLYTFYLKIIDGDYSVLWSQHNEHRIFLSRILFLTDIYLLFLSLNTVSPPCASLIHSMIAVI